MRLIHELNVFELQIEMNMYNRFSQGHYPPIYWQTGKGLIYFITRAFQ